MQEEAAAIGAPLLVLRERTERPEGIVSNNIALVGRDANAIVSAVTELLGDRKALARMRTPALPYGDGRASDRIADVIQEWLGSSAGSCDELRRERVTGNSR